jgi:hypothetical protein
MLNNHTLDRASCINLDMVEAKLQHFADQYRGTIADILARHRRETTPPILPDDAPLLPLPEIGDLPEAFWAVMSDDERIKPAQSASVGDRRSMVPSGYIDIRHDATPTQLLNAVHAAMTQVAIAMTLATSFRVDTETATIKYIDSQRDAISELTKAVQ